LRCDVVTLYRGGRYHLYCYRRYTDVRLVFAPEQQAAFFGGDPDNFEYPRFDLDVMFFRVYEDGVPAETADYLAWNPGGTKEGDLVFVSGHPGRTERLNTVDHLEFLRDVQMPGVLASLYRREVLLKVYAARCPENARRAHAAILGVENSRKARGGMLDGLRSPAFFAGKRAVEERLRKVYAEKAGTAGTGRVDPWTRIRETLVLWESFRRPYELLENASALQCRQFSIARSLVRLAEEDLKPNEERLPEYRDSARESLEQTLFSEAPIYVDLETLTLGDSLGYAMECAVETPEVIHAIYGGEPTMAPKEFAASLVSGTRVADVAYRKELAVGAAVEASDDPMIQLARRVDALSRELRRRCESEVDEPMKQAYAELAELQFEVYGETLYPDATFTLRLAFGQVKGYGENGRNVPAYTQMGGMFERSEAMGGGTPFDLPERWVECRDRINPETPFNFVSTADIIGGNSGSPVVDRSGRFVGIIFDGNIQSLVLDYGYTEEQARATSVDVRAIVESLRNIYGAESVLRELTL
ncbi:MAG: S46 family peptidase, partial [Planctomycetia bacterium]|nr:S46 family peptidase [Planctomycetia bacterium]